MTDGNAPDTDVTSEQSVLNLSVDFDSHSEKLGEDIYEEYEHVELEHESVEEETILTEYDPDDFVSTAFVTPNGTIPENTFEFEHSYGYNCHKYFNLCGCDETVVCWSAGSIITFFDVVTKQTWFRRSSTGGSVGSITAYRKEPNYRLAIAEGREYDNEPIIILYFWPSMEMDAVLREGTENAYSMLDFSPDGELLASLGKEPDYNITIWNWKRHKILLRTNAFTFDVNNVMFSMYCPGQLTTAGAAHIKFWKMAQTFTGLKLKGELGRFGKTEICDVLGIYPMPDEKVLSGCEWGNILVWEAGLVKVEVTKKGRKNCHKAPIIQFMLSPAGDEVTTIARDGCIRAWYWDTVEQADPPEDDQFVELNPVAELCVEGCQIMCLKHQKDSFYYAQDGNGGIWTIELELDKLENELNHRKVLTTHAGAIVGMIAMRFSPILLTAGEDGCFHAYSMDNHVLLARIIFPVPITCIFYPPLDMDPSSNIVMLGFQDGIMRTLYVHPDRLMIQEQTRNIRVHSNLTIHSDDSVNADVMDMISLLKPHSKAIHQITVNHRRTILVTIGEDQTIFLYDINNSKRPFVLERLGFIETPNIIAYATWHPDNERVLLMGGRVGLLMQAVLPDVKPRPYTEITTFKLEFESWTESLIKKQFMRHRPFPEEEDLASIDEEALKAAAEASEKEEEEEEWIGAIELMESDSMLGTTITWCEYCADGVWVIQKGTGALLLVKPGSNKILKYAPFPGAWCEEITVLRFVCEERYLIIGTNTGYIRMFRMPTEMEDNPFVHHQKWQLSMQKLLKKLKGRRLRKEETQPIPRIDFEDYYHLEMHDFYTGALTCIEINGDATRLFTCGRDGNIFSFYIKFPEPLIPPFVEEEVAKPKLVKVREPSTVESELMSHEQLKQKEEYDKMMAIANAHKKRVRDKLAEITVEYNKLIKANKMLPWSQQIDVTLDPRPLVVQEEEIEVLRQLAKRKVAHQLEASTLGLQKMHSRNIIQLDVFPFTLKAIGDPNLMIRPFRQKNLSPAFWEQLDEVHRKMAEAALKGKRAEAATRRVEKKRASWGSARAASFLMGLPPNPPHHLKKALRNYYIRLNRHHNQFIEWQEHLSRKPDPNALPPGAAEAIREAEATIGNRLLKTQGDYVAPAGHNTQLRLCLVRQEIYDLKHAFNMKIVELREQKLELVKRLKNLGEKLAEIHMEIPAKLAKSAPAIPDIDEDLEFPDKNLEIKPDSSETMKSSAAKKQAALRAQQSDRKLFPQQRIKPPKVPRFVTLAESRPMVASWEILKYKPEYESSEMEIELRDRRIKRRLYEQDVLIAETEEAIKKFDGRISQLKRERIRIQENNTLLELHLYQLHQEMNVLNRFEAHEDKLAERVYSKLMQVKAVQEQINECEMRIEEHGEEKVRLDVACQELQRQFKRLAQDNKFADFLRRIFKKKYRPPRDKDDDDESESESESSSSEEEDEGSLDSRDIGPIRLDPNICPEGCDREVYDKTFELRDKRHKYEQEIIEQNHYIDLLRRDIDGHNKEKRRLTIQLDKRKNTLKEFMMEKQNCLNEIDQLVILHYDQIRVRVLKDCTTTKGLSDSIVFSEGLLQRLRKRVLELQEEIKQQKQRQKINRTHLFRMNIDLREMERQAEEIRAQMRDVLTRKLGRPRKVDKILDDLLRQMARRHKFHTSLSIQPHMLEQLRSWNEKLSEEQQKYIKELNLYSERLRLAATLQADVLAHMDSKTEPNPIFGSYCFEEYQRDVVRLRIIRCQQLKYIEELQNDIKRLRLKPLDYLTPPPTVREQEPGPEMISLFTIPRRSFRVRKKYFPIDKKLLKPNEYNNTVVKLLFSCLTAMNAPREDAHVLLKELLAQLPDVLTGAKSRYEVVDVVIRKMLKKYGEDPKKAKKLPQSTEALASLADLIIKQHVETIEGPSETTHCVMQKVEDALKDISKEMESLSNRLPSALATLLHTASLEDIETEETMASLVNSLIDEKHPLSAVSLNKIDVNTVINDIKDCGIQNVKQEDLDRLVRTAIECLQAQVIPATEQQEIEKDVLEAMAEAQKLIATSSTDVDVRSETAYTIGVTDSRRCTCFDPPIFYERPKDPPKEKTPSHRKTDEASSKTEIKEKASTQIEAVEKASSKTQAEKTPSLIKTDEQASSKTEIEEKASTQIEAVEKASSKTQVEETPSLIKTDEQASSKTEVEEKASTKTEVVEKASSKTQVEETAPIVTEPEEKPSSKTQIDEEATSQVKGEEKAEEIPPTEMKTEEQLPAETDTGEELPAETEADEKPNE